MIKQICQTCHQEFNTHLSCKAKFCSRECYYRSKWGEVSRKEKYTCPRCGIPFSAYRARYGLHRFCCLSCKFLGERKDIALNIPPEFGYWFAGLVDGEGCFFAPQKGKSVTNRFTIALRLDDKQTIEYIYQTLGIGYLGFKKGQFDKRYNETHNPQLHFVVSQFDECRALCDLFDKYPLQSKKKQDYEIWKGIVREREKGRLSASPLLSQLAKNLRTIKEYKP